MILFFLLPIISFLVIYIITGFFAQYYLKSCTGLSFINHSLWYYKLDRLFKDKAYSKISQTLLTEDLEHYLLHNEDRRLDLLPYIHKIEFPLNLFSKYYIREEGYVLRYTELCELIDNQFRRLKVKE